MQPSAKTIDPWWELNIAVPAARAEDAAALLVDGGAMGVQTVANARQLRRAWQAHASMGPAKSPAEATTPVVVDAHERVYLIASYEGDISAENVRHTARDAFSDDDWQAAIADANLVRRADDDWAHAWKQHFKPMKVGRRMWIVPSWESSFAAPVGSIVLNIDPGMAFGTGQHATTALCLKAVERYCDASRAADKRGAVLDVGCGSGILALAALQLGMPEAFAVDIDQEAVDACQENVDRAKLGARCKVSLALPEPAQGNYALVIANILAHTLVEMAELLLAQLAPGGTLLLSGILVEQADMVIRAYAKTAKAMGLGDFPLRTRLQHEQWVALVFGRSLEDGNAAR